MFGKELIIDLHKCNTGLFNELDIDHYINVLCGVIDMERMGPLNYWYYDGEREHLKGISVSQFIRTSSIVLHACNGPATLYVNVFSCKDFDEQKATKFTEDYFEGVVVSFGVIDRV